MIAIAATIAGLALVAVLWFLYGVLAAIRSTLAGRVTAWLLPDNQPVTFRVAQVVALLAQALMPSDMIRFRPAGQKSRTFYLLFPVQFVPVVWHEPAAALAELDADLAADRRVLRPVALTAPLLWLAFVQRLIYLREFGVCILWLPVGLLLHLVPLVLHDELMWSRIRSDERFQSLLTGRKRRKS